MHYVCIHICRFEITRISTIYSKHQKQKRMPKWKRNRLVRVILIVSEAAQIGNEYMESVVWPGIIVCRCFPFNIFPQMKNVWLKPENLSGNRDTGTGTGTHIHLANNDVLGFCYLVPHHYYFADDDCVEHTYIIKLNAVVVVDDVAVASAEECRKVFGVPI